MGFGSNVIAIDNGDNIVHGLVMIDCFKTGSPTVPDEDPEKGKKILCPELIGWYKEKINMLSNMGCKETTVITHVPLYEYKLAFDAVDNGLTYQLDTEMGVKRATYKIDGEYTNTLPVPTAGTDEIKVAYVAEQFQMETVPATDIPTIGPVMKRIPLVAEPRRIAVRYDQITAYQAKTDYGFSLDKQIAEQACGELAYEIDSEIVDMLYQAAKEVTTEATKEGDMLGAMLTWSKTLPVGVSKYEHYQGFLEVVETARAIIYNRTKKFHPNYMVVAADVLPVLKFINGWTGTKVLKANGPYKVGELDNISVYVSPDIASGEYFFGLNGNDMMSSAGVYAPYMAIVPTQLLGTPDGGLAQGFSTWYAKALLNKNLLVAGKIVA
jgi:hypothetical protein